MPFKETPASGLLGRKGQVGCGSKTQQSERQDQFEQQNTHTNFSPEIGKGRATEWIKLGAVDLEQRHWAGDKKLESGCRDEEMRG